MNVWIARDGETIGEYPRESLDLLAQSSELQTTDHYWHEGMENWRQLDELLGESAWQPPAKVFLPSYPRRKLAFAIAIAGAGLTVACVLAYLLSSRNWTVAQKAAAPSVATTHTPFPTKVVIDLIVRQRAISELNERIKDLPAAPGPSIRSYYTGVAVAASPESSPLTATVTGTEEVVDPSSLEFLWHIPFILTAEYVDGAWRYVGLRAYGTNVAENATYEFNSAGTSSAAPNLARMLGLLPRSNVTQARAP